MFVLIDKNNLISISFFNNNNELTDLEISDYDLSIHPDDITASFKIIYKKEYTDDLVNLVFLYGMNTQTSKEKIRKWHKESLGKCRFCYGWDRVEYVPVKFK